MFVFIWKGKQLSTKSTLSTLDLCSFFHINHIQIGLGRVRILIKTRLKVKFDIFSIVNLSNFTFNRFLMSIRTRPNFNLI
jgi:hypothetical protein